VVCPWIGDSVGGLESALDCAARSLRELFHRGALSDAGDGIWCDGGWAGITVVTVEVDDVVEVEAADDANLAEPDGSTTDDAIYDVLAPCWGRVAAEDATLDVDDGGDGNRDAPPLDEGCCEVGSADC
jgi:hypothetical protein